ncbi:peroxidase 7 [Ananas comosus]|uniref:Peroxidase n=1 Tax=Ananas comosus TaxID=4615 RepID=A0A6P5FL73_ANACO|nr:peroxidase 7 [Ananas comosus]
MGLSSSLSIAIFLLYFTSVLAGPDKKKPDYLTQIDGLDTDYYRKTCPKAEEIISKKVKHWISKDYTLGASLLRLHFHDCAIRGCDGSVLVNTTGSERYAKASKTLRGFDVIDDIKAELEDKCPKTVSCADILTAVARDATHEIGGPYWSLKYGRKDGRKSLAEEAEGVPMGRESVTGLIQFFQSKGLTLLDLVVLSGAHTIGRCSCGSIQYRIYNYTEYGLADPSIDLKFLNFLQRKCRQASEYTELDAVTPTIFDSVYYKNLQQRMGLLSTDQMLYADSRTGPLVKALAAQHNLFYQQFGVSMKKLSKVQVLTGDEGEVRTKCFAFN